MVLIIFLKSKSRIIGKALAEARRVLTGCICRSTLPRRLAENIVDIDAGITFRKSAEGLEMREPNIIL